MALSDLTDDQLEQLGKIREKRAELTRQAVQENADLLRIANAASTRRSEKRHRFMLLAGGIVGVSAPLLLQSNLLVDVELLRLGSLFLLGVIVVGALFDAIDDRRTNPILRRNAIGLQNAAALALADEMRFLAASNRDDLAEIEEMVKKAETSAGEADKRANDAGALFVDVSLFESILFYGLFVMGVGLMILAVGSAGLGSKRIGMAVPTFETSQVVLDCSFLDAGLGLIQTQAMLRIEPASRRVLNLSFMPARTGTATIGESDYLLEFSDKPVFKERFTVNRFTGVGSRELVDDKGEVGPKDHSMVTCKPYQGKPL